MDKDRDLSQKAEKVGPYSLRRMLGAGGMGEVYLAYDQRLDRSVAIKHILPEAAENSKIRERLRREARAVASLNHPAIVQIYDIVEDEKGDWIVMELIEGPTLRQLVEYRAIDIVQTTHVIAQVAAGLAEAHANGIVHRDLKTENVMISGAGQAKILDFGLAKNMWSTNETALSVQGAIVGTGRAMSPEQAKGEKIDARSDLFSLGTMFYESLTGKPPFFGDSLIHTLAQVCSDQQPPLYEVDSGIPRELSDYIDRLLAKKPEDRPASAVDVARFLGGILRDLDPEGESGFGAGSDAFYGRRHGKLERAAVESLFLLAVAGRFPGRNDGRSFSRRPQSSRRKGDEEAVYRGVERIRFLQRGLHEDPGGFPEHPRRNDLSREARR